MIVTLSGCKSDETRLKEAEKVAQGFSIAWQQENYGSAYDYIIPDLQSLRNKQDFIQFVSASQDLNKFNFIYDKVVLQDKNLAYAYYTFSGESAFQPKTPAIEMNLIGSEWKLNGFAGYFTKECIVDDCEKEVRKNFEADIYQETLYCIKNHPSLGYDYCKESAESALEMTMSVVFFKCNKSTKFKCEEELTEEGKKLMEK